MPDRRAIVICMGHLVGAMALGEWGESITTQQGNPENKAPNPTLWALTWARWPK